MNSNRVKTLQLFSSLRVETEPVRCLGYFIQEAEGFVTSIHFRRDRHEQDQGELNIPLRVKERQEGRKKRMDREEKEGKMTVTDVLGGSFSRRHTKAAFQNNRSHMISRAKQTVTLREQDEVTCKKVTWLTPPFPSQMDLVLQFCIILFSPWSPFIIFEQHSCIVHPQN